MEVIQCTKCQRILADYNDSGVRRLRTKVVLFDKSITTAVCPKCQTSVAVPIKFMDKNEQKATKLFIFI